MPASTLRKARLSVKLCGTWTYKRNLRFQGLVEMRHAWLEAIASDSEDEDPEPVLDALEKRFDTLAKASEQACGKVFSVCPA